MSEPLPAGTTSAAAHSAYLRETVQSLGVEQARGAVRFGQVRHYRGRTPTLRFTAIKPVRDHPQKLWTVSITAAHRDAFEALTSGCSSNFALFSCIVDGHRGDPPGWVEFRDHAALRVGHAP